MRVIEEPGTPCECSYEGCLCENDADVVLKDGIPICGCCVAHCPDVHPNHPLNLSGQLAEE